MKTSSFKIGDKVRVKKSVTTPRHNWGAVSHKSIGTIVRINGVAVTVDFPEQSDWSTYTYELERVPSEDAVEFKVGDRVRVKKSVSEPRHHWGEQGVDHSSIGVVIEMTESHVYGGPMMVVDFPTHKGWNADPKEMEPVTESITTAEPFVGMRVRVVDDTSSYFKVGDIVTLTNLQSDGSHKFRRDSDGLTQYLMSIRYEVIPTEEAPEDKTHTGFSLEDYKGDYARLEKCLFGEMGYRGVVIDIPEKDRVAYMVTTETLDAAKEYGINFPYPSNPAPFFLLEIGVLSSGFCGFNQQLQVSKGDSFTGPGRSLETIKTKVKAFVEAVEAAEKKAEEEAAKPKTTLYGW